MKSSNGGSVPDFDAVIVGAGFAGLYMLHRLLGLGLRACVFEAGGDVGGTWYWNRYPGARCDVDSLEYSYSFDEDLQQEWRWSEKSSPQAEILRYLGHVADRFALRPHIRFDTRVEALELDEATGLWGWRTSRGDTGRARWVVLATGCLSSPNRPDFEGLDDFEGEWFHTGNWPHDGVDFTGKTVGVVGTGSSGVQSIPVIANEARHVRVFQRTPGYVIPARNVPLDPDVERRVKADYAGFRAANREMPFALGAHCPRYEDLAAEVPPDERERRMEAAWREGGIVPIGTCFADTILDESANRIVADFVKGKIREIVRDPATAETLCPTTPIGCKRVCIGTDYYETFNRPNVTLVDVREDPIVRVGPRSLETGSASHPLDALVFATGFDAMTGSILRIDVRGRGGTTLREKWSAGPRTFLGLGTAGFPNLFLISGPGSPSVLSNMVVSIEQHVDFVADTIAHLRDRGLAQIEATTAAEDEWVALVNEIADTTLYPRCNSWYLGANVPGKPRVFMPFIGFPDYVAKCNDVASRGYEGFDLG